MATCTECGLDPDRGMDPWEERHHRSSDAMDVTHLRPGAQNISVDVTAARRVEMNRIARATGWSLREQICRALDCWLPEHRINLEEQKENAVEHADRARA